jgi:hypothetical protein
MKKIILFSVIIIVIVAIAAYIQNISSDVDVPQSRSLLAKMGDECELIAEKAAMKLPETLPFQKMEKLARKLHVLETCMNDRGFIQNPEWVKFAQPIAQKKALQEHISENEAYETLRRAKMIVYSPIKDEPAYWIPAKTVSEK